VTRFGYYIPFAIGGNAISAVGAGLLSTLTVSSDAGKYVGYQILCGLGRGAIMQLPASQVSIGVALITFNQFFSASIFITLTQTIFVNSLGPALKKFAPAVNTSSVINVGATSLREAVPANELTGVLMAYNEALMHTFVTPFLRGL
jgi:hypothetical protein